MHRKTETLDIGSFAPLFTLAAANHAESISLQALISRGPVILEFIRGTW